jgi:DNA processing protein
MNTIDFDIPEFKALKKLPDQLFYEGNSALLKKPKISIIGTRKPITYTKTSTFTLANALAKRGIIIVSGAAMGVDAIAHNGAGEGNTIAVMPCGLNHRYPAVNKKLIGNIAQNGLLLSQFNPEFKATPWSFVVRNELVVALGDVLIVTQCDLKSGSMRSVEYALAMGKKIYVLPHRMGESEGTNHLVANNQAEVIYDIESFVQNFGRQEAVEVLDDFTHFCKTNPSYEEAMQKFANELFEAELSGKIEIISGRVVLV